MPTKGDRDEWTGLDTTGHEWDGIRELDRPLPRWWLWVLYATIIWSVGYFVFYPGIPWFTGHNTGLLETTARIELAAELDAAEAAQAGRRSRIAVTIPEAILEDPDLLAFALAGGAAAYGDNCAPCHGSAATGGPGYPSLIDDDWIWDGSIVGIENTLRYGIRSAHPDTRDMQMPAFGRDEILSAGEIGDVAEYVLSLSGGAEDQAAVTRGEGVFDEQCAFCHGGQGEGMADLGAPRLADAIWLYGGTREDIVATVSNSRAGVMPAWEGRLDEATLKMLTVWVHSQGGGE